MSKKKSVAIIFIAVILLGAASFLYFTSSPVRSVAEVLPSDALLVVESTGTGPLWQKLKQQTAFWPDLIRIEEIERFDDQLKLVDSILDVEASVVYERLSELPMAYALYRESDSYQGVLIIRTDRVLKLYELREQIAKRYANRIQWAERKTEGIKSVLLVDKKLNTHFHFTIHSGFFVGSFDRQLFGTVVRQFGRSDGLAADSSYIRLSATRAMQADGYMWLDYELLSELAAEHASTPYMSGAAKGPSSIAASSLFDISVKPNELVLNGLSQPSSHPFSQALSRQQGIEMRITKVVPSNTRLLLQIGSDAMAEFCQEWIPNTQRQQLEKKYALDFQNGFIANLSEIALAMQYRSGRQESFFAAYVHHKAGLSAFLVQLTRSLKGSLISTEPLQGSIPAEFLLQELFGPIFNPLKGFYFMLLDDFLVIAESAEKLQEIGVWYRQGRTLAQNDNFKLFSNYLADASNCMLYVNLREGSDILLPMLGSSLTYFLNHHADHLKDFEAFAIQFAGTGELLYTNFVLKYNPDYKEESLIGWRTCLQAPMRSQPYPVDDHSSKNKQIIVFDQQNTIYFIDADGNILWKRQLQEELVGDVFTVDYYQNGKLQYLFATTNHIHLLDRTGNYVGNYPVKLRSPATSGLSVMDYDGIREYRILVNCADKHTYNYEITGKEVKGWARPKSMEMVTQAVEHLVVGGLDYLIITDIQANIRIVDRRGISRIQLRGEPNKSKYSGFYVNRTNSKGIILTTDKNGKLLYINAAGVLSRTDFGDFSEEHYFLYEDITQNRSYDFIYLDDNRLRVFDRFKKQIFSHDFKNAIHYPPKLFTLKNGKRLLGVLDEDAGEIYLIGQNGKISISSDIKASTAYTVTSLKQNETVNLLTGLDGCVVNYELDGGQ
ncbi:MAG: hypothetical protein M0Q41_03820 [Bacteroidales bacterium]|nr:hypothetical protein [Bacteroidales bacterium]